MTLRRSRNEIPRHQGEIPYTTLFQLSHPTRPASCKKVAILNKTFMGAFQRAPSSREFRNVDIDKRK